MMKNQRDENLKKIIIATVVLATFGVSYYYYAKNEQQYAQAEKPVKLAVNNNKKAAQADKKAVKVSIKDIKKVAKPEQKEEKAVASPGIPAVKNDAKVAEEPVKQVAKQEKPEIKEAKATVNVDKKQPKQEKIVIKPTQIKDLLANASKTSGKNDPFSYVESQFMPFNTCGKGCKTSRLGGLPVPPGGGDVAGPREAVIIKGFLGNKVIADIKGFTESLGVNESLQGVKVVSVDPANLTCEFIIDGEKVKKTMQPINKPNDNIEIQYITNR